jgi:hypothetical protein
MTLEQMAEYRRTGEQRTQARARQTTRDKET